MAETLFKTCPICSTQWNSLEEFLEDPATTIVGYQVNFQKLESGLFLFTHQTCNNTLSLYAHDFKHMRRGDIFTENKAGTEGCPEHCLHMEQLTPCHNTCECRWVRDVIQVIENWEKTS